MVACELLIVLLFVRLFVLLSLLLRQRQKEKESRVRETALFVLSSAASVFVVSARVTERLSVCVSEVVWVIVCAVVVTVFCHQARAAGVRVCQSIMRPKALVLVWVIAFVSVLVLRLRLHSHSQLRCQGSQAWARLLCVCLCFSGCLSVHCLVS